MVTVGNDLQARTSLPATRATREPLLLVLVGWAWTVNARTGSVARSTQPMFGVEPTFHGSKSSRKTSCGPWRLRPAARARRRRRRPGRRCRGRSGWSPGRRPARPGPSPGRHHPWSRCLERSAGRRGRRSTGCRRRWRTTARRSRLRLKLIAPPRLGVVAITYTIPVVSSTATSGAAFWSRIWLTRTLDQVPSVARARSRTCGAVDGDAGSSLSAVVTTAYRRPSPAATTLSWSLAMPRAWMAISGAAQASSGSPSRWLAR